MPLEHFGHHSLVNITRAQLIEKGYRHLQLFFRIRQRALRLIGVKSGAEIRPSCQMPVGAAKPLQERNQPTARPTASSTPLPGTLLQQGYLHHLQKSAPSDPRQRDSPAPSKSSRRPQAKIALIHDTETSQLLRNATSNPHM